MIEKLGDSDSSVRQDAARQLGLHKVQEAVPRLIELLEDPDIDTVEEAGAALGEIGDEGALGPMVAVYTKNQEYLSPDFEEAIVKLGGQEDVSRLERDAKYWKPKVPEREPESYFSKRDIVRHLKYAISKSRSVEVSYISLRGFRAKITMTPTGVFRTRKGFYCVQGCGKEDGNTYYLHIRRIIELKV